MSTQTTKEKTVADNVLARIKTFESCGELRLPPDYSVENALKSAWLLLQETSNKDHKKALEHCTQASIANSLLDMVVQGLNPMKKQCYFIMYGTQLQMARSYMGTVAVAKRCGGITDVRANVIYEGDEFEFEIDPMTGDKKIVKHKQSLESLNGEIIGAYAILTLAGGGKYIEIMPMKQIEKSWSRGKSQGNSAAHKDHPEEMCKKTVVSRACKIFINTSDDSALFDASDEYDGRNHSKEEIVAEANQGEIITLEEDQIVETKENTENEIDTGNTSKIITPDGQAQRQATQSQITIEDDF